MSAVPEAIQGFYGQGREKQRLLEGDGRLEYARTMELLGRFLPPTPAVILDVGGGPGIYSCALARQGYVVHLIDPIPLHLLQAAEESAQQPEFVVTTITQGDARQLNWPASSVDAVLMLGPLYHLTERADRLLALSEAYRVLKVGGRVFAVGISRFASALDGLRSHLLDEPAFRAIVTRDLQDGQHRNPPNADRYFTTAFFHHPDELRQELKDAGFALEYMLGVEGPAWLLQDLNEQWDNPDRRGRLLEVVRSVETEWTLVGASSHIMGVGRKGN